MSRTYVLTICAGVVLCFANSSHAQNAFDLTGTWARADEAGRIGAETVLGFHHPTCNDVWNATGAATAAEQGRGSFRISSLGAQWRIADQEPNISFFGNSFPDVGTQDLALTTNADGTTSVGWGGETFGITMDAAPDGLRMTLMSLDGTVRHYARCPVAPGASSDARWIPPEKTRISYLRCSILYDLLQRAAGAQGDRDSADYFDAVKSRWSEASTDLPSTADFMADYQTAFGTYQNAPDPDAAALQEFNRCGGPPPTADS